MPKRLLRRDDHGMARQRRMYARHVVRGRWHFGARFCLILADFATKYRLGEGRLAANEAADICCAMNEALRSAPGTFVRATGPLQLSVIVPTFNERDNVTTLFRRLETTLAGIAWEAIFVDDNSPDGTS